MICRLTDLDLNPARKKFSDQAKKPDPAPAKKPDPAQDPEHCS